MLFFFCKLWYINLAVKMQVSPIGMASASQADFGGFDSRRLPQNRAVVITDHGSILVFTGIWETRGG